MANGGRPTCTHCDKPTTTGDAHPCCAWWVTQPDWGHHAFGLHPCPACASSVSLNHQQERRVA